MPHHLLTDRRVRTAGPGRHCDGAGLYLKVEESKSTTPGDHTAARSWQFRYQRDGKDVWMGLGSAATFGLTDARDLARTCRQQLAQGLDPIAEREAERLRKKIAIEK